MDKYEEVKEYFLAMGCTEEQAEESTKELVLKGDVDEVHQKIYHDYDC